MVEQVTDPAAGSGHTDELQQPRFIPSWRLRYIILVFSLLSFMSAVDGTIITTSLPTITREIGGRELYAWIANSYMFASTVPQPFYSQISNVFGRKNPLLISLVLFALGSGIGGGARNLATFMAGRIVQALGSAGLYVLAEIIICDLVPPRHRGPYLSCVLSAAAIGTTVGPILGGAIVAVNWRWIFWINLPVSGVGLLSVVLLLDLKHRQNPTWLSALLRIDFLGNAIFILAMIAIFFGLINGGVVYSWSSWRIVLPLVLGICGWVTFHIYESLPICKEPTMPPHLFKHRTSAGGYILIFLSAVVVQATNYFLPVYFLAAKGVSPLTSGVYFLPFALCIIPFAGFAGFFISKMGLYRPLHWTGFALSAIGCGLFSILKESSSTATWVCFQIIVSGGAGFIFASTLQSTLAPLEESDVAAATGTYAFMRTFGLVWGITIASIVFNGQIETHLSSIGDEAVRSKLANGAAYSYASGNFIPSLQTNTKTEVIIVYVAALRVVWLTMAAVSCLGFFCVFIEQHVSLRQEHKSEFGLVEDAAITSSVEVGQEKTPASKL